MPRHSDLIESLGKGKEMKKTKLRTRRDIEEFKSGLNPQKLYIDQYGEIWHGDSLAEAIAENAEYGYARFHNRKYEERDYIVWYVVMYEKGKRTGQYTTSLKLAKEMLSEIVAEYPKAHIIREKQYAAAKNESNQKPNKAKPQTENDCGMSDICEKSDCEEAETEKADKGTDTTQVIEAVVLLYKAVENELLSNKLAKQHFAKKRPDEEYATAVHDFLETDLWNKPLKTFAKGETHRAFYDFLRRTEKPNKQ